MTKTNLLLEHSDLAIVIEVQQETNGNSLAELAQTHTRWEVVQSEAEPNLSALRVSWMLSWRIKPWIGASFLAEKARAAAEEHVVYIVDNFIPRCVSAVQASRQKSGTANTSEIQDLLREAFSQLSLFKTSTARQFDSWGSELDA